VLAIFIMAVFASMIMKVMVTYRWLSWVGLIFLVYLTAIMLFDGARDIGLLTA
jgi:predicted tellurium resistance membrane protein TerC